MAFNPHKVQSIFLDRVEDIELESLEWGYVDGGVTEQELQAIFDGMESLDGIEKYAFDDWVNSLGELSDKDEDVLAEHESWVDDNISKVYWNFRDELSDTSSEVMDEYLNSEFKMRMMKILWEEYGGGKFSHKHSSYFIDMLKGLPQFTL